jgi:hypothetical protein
MRAMEAVCPWIVAEALMWMEAAGAATAGCIAKQGRFRKHALVAPAVGARIPTGHAQRACRVGQVRRVMDAPGRRNGADGDFRECQSLTFACDRPTS